MRVAWILLPLLLAACHAPKPVIPADLPGIGAAGRDYGSAALTRHVGDGRTRNVHPFVAVHDGHPWVYYSSDRDGAGFNVYRQRLDSFAAERVTDHPGDELWPRVSPDGTRVAYGSRRDGRWRICVLDLHSGASTCMTDEVNDSIQPAWSADGSTIVYSGWLPGEDNWALQTVDLFAGVHSLLLTSGGRPLIGTHPAYLKGSDTEVMFQDATRLLPRWFELKQFDLRSGRLLSLAPVRAWGGIQPSPLPGGGLIAISVAKADAAPVGGDGFVLMNARGHTVSDVREPGGLDEVASPMVVALPDGDRVFFSARDGEAEGIWSMPLARAETTPPKPDADLQAH
jgi:hypothetical protein